MAHRGLIATHRVDVIWPAAGHVGVAFLCDAKNVHLRGGFLPGREKVVISAVDSLKRGQVSSSSSAVADVFPDTLAVFVDRIRFFVSMNRYPLPK